MPNSDWRFSPYLFHVHTSCTDGVLTVAQSVDFAEQAGARTVVFLEHIRRQPGYDVERFVTEVKQAGRTSTRTVVGFEAKLLPDRTLDIPDRCVESAGVIGIAEHGFPNDCGLLSDAFRNVVKTYPSLWPRIAFVWVHPGLWFKRRRSAAPLTVVARASGSRRGQRQEALGPAGETAIERANLGDLQSSFDPEGDEVFQEMLAAACDAGVLVEQNLRYGLLSAAAAAKLPASHLVTGADAHSLADLERWAEHLHERGRRPRAFEVAAPVCPE